MPDRDLQNLGRTQPVPQDLQAVLLWIAEHDGRIEAWWDQQHRWNLSFEKEVRLSQRELSTRLTSVERRMIYVAGIAAGAGSILFNLAASALRSW